MKREIERCSAVLHGIRPALDQLHVAIGELSHCELVRQAPDRDQTEIDR
jgi:hypothetical protein